MSRRTQLCLATRHTSLRSSLSWCSVIYRILESESVIQIRHTSEIRGNIQCRGGSTKTRRDAAA